MPTFGEAVAAELATTSEATPETTEPAVEATEGDTAEGTALTAEAPTPEATEDTGAPEAPTAEKYTYKADGTEREATLEELRELAAAGHNYTRKSQELAVQRQQVREAEALWNALTDNPEETVRKLAEQLGLEDGDPVDPEEARIQRLERTVQQDHAARDEAARMQAIDRSLAELHTQYGEFEEADLLEHAITRGIPDLRAAYADMKFEDIRAQAIEASEAKKAAADAQRLDAKRDAAVVAGGSTSQAGAVADNALPAKPSVREALLAALKQ